MLSISSLRTGAAMEPYYVIDGIPGMSLSLIAPEDIESIDVLRDASATAIYGSIAAPVRREEAPRKEIEAVPEVGSLLCTTVKPGTLPCNNCPGSE